MSSSTAFGATNSPRADRLSAGWLRYSAGSLFAVLSLIGAILVWRRMTGSLGQPLPATTMATWGLLLSAAVLCSRWLWRRGSRQPASRRDTFSHWGASLLLIALAAAVSVVGTSPAALAVLWGIVALEEGVACLARRRNALEIASPSSRSGLPSEGEPRVGDGVGMGLGVESPPGDFLLGDRVTQEFVRYRSADGNDVYTGRLRVAMPAGGRAASAHIAFCPPFARVPAIEVEREEGPSGRVQPVQVLPYGARLDLRLDRAAEEESTVVLRFSATSSDA
ncbi:MAG: hypothetical protein GX621_02555 [Pirellulaceae bacterium]|nr:hypothetical protein [Pirellulaceae bacterium]